MEQLLVAVIVFAAACFSAWRLMPARRRLQLLLALDGWSARHPSMTRWRERSLKPRIARAGGAGCDGCAAHGAPSTRRPR